jgi:molybdate transport system ATP-binding protein
LPAQALRASSSDDAPAVWLRADYVLLAVSEPQGLSARNIWRGTISAIERERDESLLVHVSAKLGPVLARVTPDAAADLHLAKGQTIWAIVKAHSI